jgi:hypothetical protein
VRERERERVSERKREREKKEGRERCIYSGRNKRKSYNRALLYHLCPCPYATLFL